MLFGFASMFAGVKLIESGQKDFEKARKEEDMVLRKNHNSDGEFKKTVGACLLASAAVKVIWNLLIDDKKK